MASDFGDEAGEKLYDWMLQLGKQAGELVAENAADRFSIALQHAKEGKPENAKDAPAAKEWAKLDMAEFKEIEGYPELQQVISDKLTQNGIEHSFFDDARKEKTYLLFKTAEAAKLAESFDELIEQTQGAKEKVKESLGKMEEAEPPIEVGSHSGQADSKTKHSEEPLEAKAEKSREASEQIERERKGGKGHGHEPRFQEIRGK